MLRALRGKFTTGRQANRVSPRGRFVRPTLEALEGKALMTGTTLSPTLLLPTGFSPTVGSASPFSTAITPTQMRQAYGVSASVYGSITGNGNGQAIAIVDAYRDPNIANDIAAFDSYYNLPAPAAFVQLTQVGSSNVSGVQVPPSGTNWGLETALDVEWAHTIAPGAVIVVVEANSSSLSDLLAAVSYARTIPAVSAVSMSFAGGEFQGETSYDSTFTTTPGHENVTFVASSGDGGALNGGSSPSVLYPAASPNVLSVGGTTLSAPGGAYSSETAWSGSGGGVSAYEARPSYQNSVSTNPNRTVPDVAMDADPNTGASVYDSYDGTSSTPWFQVGGTSLAAPMVAGVIAIANQVRQNSYFLPTLDGPSETLPLIYALPRSDFHDITSGNNGYYSAAAGYDLVTGVGTPVANNLIADLTNQYKNGAAFAGSLSSGQSFTSPNGLYKLTMGSNGNLVEAGPNGIIWATNVTSPGATATMQSDGDLVVKNTAGTKVWESFTTGNNNSYLNLNNNGQLQIANGATANVIWTTSTLVPGQLLGTNFVVTSADGKYGLLMGSNGDFFEYGGAPNSFDAHTTNGTIAGLEASGNFVVKSGSTTVYSAGTAVTAPASYYGQAPILYIDTTGRISIWFAGQIRFYLN